MKLRKIIIIGLTAAMIMSFTACNDSSSTSDSEGTVTTAEATEETTEVTAEPATKEESTVSDDSQTEENDSTEATDDTEAPAEDAASDGAPAGDGLMSEEDLQKGWAWTRTLGFQIYSTTYEEIATSEYFGVDGELKIDEYAENIKRNRRVYKWISKEDETHYIMINFEERDAEENPGVYTLTAISANGFDGAEAEKKYGDEVK